MKNYVKGWVIAAGLSGLVACSISSLNKKDEVSCNTIPLTRSRAEIEQMIEDDANATADEVFDSIDSRIKFSDSYDEELFTCKDKWSSMQETYSVMKGDCEDGAIVFKARLSRNPRYHVELIFLLPEQGKQHSIDAILDKETGFWSYVSFNENGLNHKSSKRFRSRDEAVSHFNKRLNNAFERYAVMDNFTDEELKFGSNLDKHKGRNPRWVPLR